MASPPFLAVRNSNGSNAQVGRLLGGTTFTQVGNNLSATMETPTSYYSNPCNRAIQFGDSLYAIHQNQVYKLSSPWTTWSSVKTLSIISTQGYSLHTGFHVVDNAGVPTLVILYADSSSSDGAAAYSTDGSTWTETGSLTTSTISSNRFGRSYVYRNSVFWTKDGTSKVIQFDISSVSMTEYTTLGGSSVPNPGGAGMCAFENELYLVSYDGTAASDEAWLYKLSGGAFVSVQRVGTTAPSVLNQLRWEHRYGGAALFPDAGKLYCIISGRNGVTSRSGANCFELTPSGSTFTETYRSETVIPASLRTTDANGTITDGIGEEFRWYVGIDNETSPTSPAIYLWFLNDDNGGNWSYYEWNGPTTLLSSGSSAGSVGLAMPQFTEGGGARYWTSGENHVEIVSTGIGSGGALITFKAYGGGTGKTVQFYRNGDEEAPDAQATLTGTATGGSATRSGNTVTGVAADGSTSYTIVWDFFTDNFGIGDNYNLMPAISG